MRIMSMLISNQGFLAVIILFIPYMDYASVHDTEIKNLIAECRRKTIARGINSSASDSFAIEYDVKPAEKKVTIKTLKPNWFLKPMAGRIYRKTDRQKTVTVPYYIDYYP